MSLTAPGPAHPLTADALRRGFSMFPSGVTAVCGQRDGVPVGMAASTFTSVSLDPPLASVCVARTSSTWPLLRSSPRLGVSVLGVGYRDTVRQLAARDGDRFKNLVYRLEGEALLLDGAALWAVCSVESEVPAGDHDIVVLRVHAIEPHPEIRPLVFHASRFHELAETSPQGFRFAQLGRAGAAELGTHGVGGLLEVLFDLSQD